MGGNGQIEPKLILDTRFQAGMDRESRPSPLNANPTSQLSKKEETQKESQNPVGESPEEPSISTSNISHKEINVNLGHNSLNSSSNDLDGSSTNQEISDAPKE